MTTPLARAGCSLVVDVSRWQPLTLDFAAARELGAVAAICKATDGENDVDPRFAIHARRAAEAGLMVGAYHFFRAWHPDPRVQARQHFAAARDTSMLCPILDVEPDGTDDHVPLELVVERAADWVDASAPLWATVGKHGGLFYTFTAHLAALRATARGLAALQRIRAAGYLLWLADYRGHEPAPREGAPWPSIRGWQFGQTNIAGVSVDASWFVGGPDAIASLGETST